MQRNPLVWYRPGMISLLLLPTLCLLYLREKGIFQEYRLLPVFRITKEFYEPQKSEWVTFVRPPERQDLEILLDGNEGQAKTKLETAQRFLNQLVNQRDTVGGVQLKFGDRAKYWMFVRALNICKIEKAQHFVTLENSVRAYYQEPEILDSSKMVKPFPFCESGWKNDRFEQAEQQLKKEKHLALLLKFWPLGLIFSALIAFSLAQSRFDNF